MKKSIPDLRVDHQEFTLEHCSVLQERLGRFLDMTYGPGMSEIADQTDPVAMRDELLSLMSANQLSKMFSNTWGQGLLVGLYYGHFILKTEIKE